MRLVHSAAVVWLVSHDERVPDRVRDRTVHGLVRCVGLVQRRVLWHDGPLRPLLPLRDLLDRAELRLVLFDQRLRHRISRWPGERLVRRLEVARRGMPRRRPLCVEPDLRHVHGRSRLRLVWVDGSVRVRDSRGSDERLVHRLEVAERRVSGRRLCLPFVVRGVHDHGRVRVVRVHELVRGRVLQRPVERVVRRLDLDLRRLRRRRPLQRQLVLRGLHRPGRLRLVRGVVDVQHRELIRPIGRLVLRLAVERQSVR
jgi:hypothetical protein